MAWGDGGRSLSRAGRADITGEYRYTVVGAERLALGTPYPRVVGWVKIGGAIRRRSWATWWWMRRGVGSAVMDLLRRAEMGVRVMGVVITGSQAAGPMRVAGTDGGGVRDGVADGVVDEAASGDSGAAVSSRQSEVPGVGGAAAGIDGAAVGGEVAGGAG